jgi:hypothetical protein
MTALYIAAAPPDPRRAGYYPRRNIGGVNLRRRLIDLKLVQGINAAGVPVQATAYPYLAPPVYLSGYDHFLVLLSATGALSGDASGVQLVVQFYDVFSNPVAAPGSPFALTLTGASLGVVAAPILVQNFGDLVAIGVQAASPWSGGQLGLNLKAKG